MVSLAKYNESITNDFNTFMAMFKGHTTFEGCTKLGIFTNYVNASYEKLKELNDLGHSIYFTVNETSEQGRKAENIETIRAIFADDDKPRANPLKFPLNPSIIVRTSGEEGAYKHQYYWLTETTNVSEWEQVLLGIIDEYKTDLNVHDLSRILRVPGFANHKYEPASQCTLIESNGIHFNWNDIIEVFKPLPIELVQEVKGRTAQGEFDMLEKIKRFTYPNKEGWISESLNSLIAHWASHYSASNILKQIDNLYKSIPSEELEAHAARYFKARSQVPKWIKSAKAKVSRDRAQASRDKAEEYNVTNIYNEMPQDLVWDWSVLKSNSFPEECLPDYLKNAAEAVGEWNGLGRDPAIVSAMAITSALLNKNVIIHETYDQLTHYCAQGSIIVMDTGASKSSIYEAMNRPFFDYEERLRLEWEKLKNTNLFMVKAIETELKNNEAQYNKGQKEHGDSEMLVHAKRQGALQDRLEKIQVKSPALHTNDITEETIFRKLLENQGRIALISDDARKPIKILLGEYKKGNDTGEGIYISSFSGTDITRERTSGEEQRLKNPALNCLYFIQPDSAIKLRDSEMYVPSGLAARMPMFFYPVDGVDIVRKRKREDIDHDRIEPYYSRLRGLCLDRIESPLHIRLTEAGMKRCKEFDYIFANLLEGEWHGEFAKLNKFVSTSLQYATCIAALDDPEFQQRYKMPEASQKDYTLSVKYMNMGFAYAKVLFQQSVISQNSVDEEGIPDSAKKFIGTLQNMYNSGKIFEGFVNQGDFRNNINVLYRDKLPLVIDFLLEKKWLFTSKHVGEKRKLNSGFPSKLVDEGDLIYHLNIRGINKRRAMNLDKIEDRTNG